MYIPRYAVFWAQNRRFILGFLITLAVVVIGILLGLKGTLIAAVAALVALFTQAFAGMTALLMLIPWLGPILVKVLSLPVIWLLNGAGYFTSIFLAKQGHSKSVIDARIITIIFIAGVAIGYILGKLI